ISEAAHVTPENIAAIAGFFDAVRAGATPPRLDMLSMEARAIAYAMASTLRGQAAPMPWRWTASRLLFSAERPYFNARLTAPPPRTQEPTEPPADGKKHTRVRARLIGF